MYIATGQGRTTPGDKLLMSTETSCHFGHLLQVSKTSLWSLILYIFFFHDFIHVYSPGQGLTTPWGRNFDVNRNILSLRLFVASFKKISLKSDFIHFIFMILHMYIAPGQGQTASRGAKFCCQQKCPVTSFIHLLQVSKKCLWRLILYIFFSWFNTCI